jgi:hypothetical protein
LVIAPVISFSAADKHKTQTNLLSIFVLILFQKMNFINTVNRQIFISIYLKQKKDMIIQLNTDKNLSIHRV